MVVFSRNFVVIVVVKCLEVVLFLLEVDGLEEVVCLVVLFKWEEVFGKLKLDERFSFEVVFVL